MDNLVIATELKKFNITDSALAEIHQKYMPLVINGIDDKEGYKCVDNARKDVKNKRVDIEKRRKELKESSLVFGRAVDAEAKRITAHLEGVENHLEAQQRAIDVEKEKIKKEAEERRKQIIQNRINSLLAVDAPVNYALISVMSDEDFSSTLAMETVAYHEKIELQRQAAEAEKQRLVEEEARRLAKEEDEKIATMQAIAAIEAETMAFKKEKEEAARQLIEENVIAIRKAEEAAELLAAENARLAEENAAIKAKADKLEAEAASMFSEVVLEKEVESKKQLTPAAADDRADFNNRYDSGNCSCHISPPCGSCTHPGNPINQEEDEKCWEALDPEFEEVVLEDVHILRDFSKRLSDFSQSLELEIATKNYHFSQRDLEYKKGLLMLSSIILLWDH